MIHLDSSLKQIKKYRNHLIAYIIISIITISCDDISHLTLHGETMGTTYQITIINHSNNELDAIHLQEKIDSLFIQVNNIFSTYIENSELTQFNDNLSTIPIKISPSLYWNPQAFHKLPFSTQCLEPGPWHFHNHLLLEFPVWLLSCHLFVP